jgi:hypothetical protein
MVPLAASWAARRSQEGRGDQAKGVQAGGAGAGATAYPALAQAQMVVQRELESVGCLPRCRSAPSPFLELIPFFCEEFLGWPKQCYPVPGSPLAKTGEAAGGWWNGGVLGQLSGMVVRWSRPTKGRRCGVVEATCYLLSVWWF